jgi:hypothetical protein
MIRPNKPFHKCVPKIDSQFKGFEPFRYINDVLTINNPNFPNWIPLIYPKDFEIKETKEQTSFV